MMESRPDAARLATACPANSTVSGLRNSEVLELPVRRGNGGDEEMIGFTVKQLQFVLGSEFEGLVFGHSFEC